MARSVENGFVYANKTDVLRSTSKVDLDEWKIGEYNDFRCGYATYIYFQNPNTDTISLSFCFQFNFPSRRLFIPKQFVSYLTRQHIKYISRSIVRRRLHNFKLSAQKLNIRFFFQIFQTASIYALRLLLRQLVR